MGALLDLLDLKQLDAVKVLEKRPLSDHVTVVSSEPLWPLVSVEGVMASSTRRMLEIAFEHGGFVAGGFARWAASSDRTPAERGEYVRSGGDIDLFFRTHDGWRSYLARLGSTEDRDEMIQSASLSPGSLAVNLTPRLGKNNHQHNRPPTIQVVGCAVGEPSEVLRSFDFVNSMFAFDRNGAWMGEEATRLDRERVLGVSSWSSRGLVHRINKYRAKHGFLRARDLSEGRRVDHLCDAAGRCSDDRCARAWANFLLSTPADFFEDETAKYDILACGILPFDERGQLVPSVFRGLDRCSDPDAFAITPPTSSSEWRGHYLAGLRSLRDREARAKRMTPEEFSAALADFTERHRLSEDDGPRYTQLESAEGCVDHPSWTADGYCWSF